MEPVSPQRTLDEALLFPSGLVPEAAVEVLSEGVAEVVAPDVLAAASVHPGGMADDYPAAASHPEEVEEEAAAEVAEEEVVAAVAGFSSCDPFGHNVVAGQPCRCWNVEQMAVAVEAVECRVSAVVDSAGMVHHRFDEQGSEATEDCERGNPSAHGPFCPPPLGVVRPGRGQYLRLRWA